MGRWKLHFPHTYRTLGGKPGGTGARPVPYEQGKIGLSLFDLEMDPGEAADIAEQHPEIVAEIQELANRMRADLGDSLTKQNGAGLREPGRLQPGDLRFHWVPGQPLDIESK
jgi:hypothetical protein